MREMLTDFDCSSSTLLTWLIFNVEETSGKFFTEVAERTLRKLTALPERVLLLCRQSKWTDDPSCLQINISGFCGDSFP